MNSTIAKRSAEVARPLNILLPLIKEKMKEAAEAAEEAARPYWQEVGELLFEAKGNFDVASEFYAWVKRHFDFGEAQTRRYIQAVDTTATINPARSDKSNLTQRLREVGAAYPQYSTTPRVSRREWHQPVDDIVERARNYQTRLREEELTRQQERQAERQLALRLIDIGYKVLAKELHPDKGGSSEAMKRLRTVVDRLRAHA